MKYKVIASIGTTAKNINASLLFIENVIINIFSYWEKFLESRGTVNGILEENDVDAVMYDERLDGFLEALMEAAWSIDTSGFDGTVAGRARMMENALEKAADADLNDPYAVYEAAASLAKAYDRLLEALA